MRILLVYAAAPRYGGWPSYLGHLWMGLNFTRDEPLILQPRKRTSDQIRTFPNSVPYMNASRDALLDYASQTPTLIVAQDKNHASIVRDLRDAGAGLVVHDPTETVVPGPGPIITVRRTMEAKVDGSVYVPHPYAPSTVTREKLGRAVAFSRLDFDKHTDEIVAANMLGAGIDVFGEANSRYLHIRFGDSKPDWHRGRIPYEDLNAGARLARSYRWVVDASRIAGDGGGTQYTFLEAFNAGAGLAVSEGWMTGDPALDEIAPAAHTFADASDLYDLIAQEPDKDRIDAGFEILRDHDARKVAGLVREILV